MSVRRSLLAVVAIGAVLVPAASAQASDYKRVSGAATGEATVNTSTLQLTADVDAWLLHIGRADMQWRAVGSRAEGIVRAVGPLTITTRSGDTLTGTGSMVGVGPTLTPHPAGLIMTILGGTGRFAQASGTLVTAPMLIPRPFTPPVISEAVEGTVHGFIDF